MTCDFFDRFIISIIFLQAVIMVPHVSDLIIHWHLHMPDATLLVSKKRMRIFTCISHQCVTIGQFII